MEAEIGSYPSLTPQSIYPRALNTTALGIKLDAGVNCVHSVMGYTYILLADLLNMGY